MQKRTVAIATYTRHYCQIVINHFLSVQVAEAINDSNTFTNTNT